MSDAALEKRIEGSPPTRFFQECFGDSAQFPIANILLDLLLEGPVGYLVAPDAYASTLAAMVQTRSLSCVRKSMEGGAALGEELISADVATVLEVETPSPKRRIAVKGKEMPIQVHLLLG